MQDSPSGRFRAIVNLTDKAVFCQTGKHLSSTEILVLEGTWAGKKYPQIALDHGYASEYLKNDVGPKLWRRLSGVFGEKVSKANVRIILQKKLPNTQPNTSSVPENSYLDDEQSALNIISPQLRNDFQKASLAPLSPATTSKSITTQPVLHNLPCCTTPLIGRQQELQQLKDYFSPKLNATQSRVSIEGIGGIGKTHLMLEFAHYCLQISERTENQQDLMDAVFQKFEAIIFISAQSQQCTSHGLIPKFKQDRNLQDILHTILHTLRHESPGDGDYQNLHRHVHQQLVCRQTLLLVDNFDTLENPEEILGFIYSLPATVKVILTSREKILTPSIRLRPFSIEDTSALIHYHCSEKNIDFDQKQLKFFYKISGGLPSAIIYSISLMISNYKISEIPQKIFSKSGKFSDFYFEQSLQRITEESSSKVLITLSLFPTFTKPQIINFIAEMIDESTLMRVFHQLESFFLIYEHHRRYSVTPLLRRYVKNELGHHQDFRQMLRRRWVDWYLNFTQWYQSQSPKDIYCGTTLAQEWENIKEVMEWCIHNHHYQELQQLWVVIKQFSIPRTNFDV